MVGWDANISDQQWQGNRDVDGRPPASIPPFVYFNVPEWVAVDTLGNQPGEGIAPEGIDHTPLLAEHKVHEAIQLEAPQERQRSCLTNGLDPSLNTRAKLLVIAD